ncbi:MAG: neutral/alkaline non-lysosomal ceramidase N-terminal domain-containing protein [Myxococcota bacterium]
MSEWHAGFAICDLQVPGGKDMAGYGPMATKGEVGEALYARALYLRVDEEEIALVAVDLMGASTWLLRKTAALADLDEGRIVLAGTHTHTAPGRWFGAPFYDAFAHRLKVGKLFDKTLAKHLAERIATAIHNARSAAMPATVSLGRALCHHAGSNRSYDAFCKNPEAEHWPAAIGVKSPAQGKERAVDPRVTVISARADGELVGAFATFGCHATALGVDQKTYARDWPGETIAALGDVGEKVAVAQGAGGDVSPLPPEGLDDPKPHQGASLAKKRGAQVADAIRKALVDSEELNAKLAVASAPWAPPREDHWAVGWALMGGAEDARAPFHRWPFKCIQEGNPCKDRGEPQGTKCVIRVAQLRSILRLSPYHRLHRVTLGSHTLFTLPAEPTAVAASRVERVLIERFGGTASVVGYAGDYIGYLTTAEEYALQHYEGASMLYGMESVESLGVQLRIMHGVSKLPPLDDALEETAFPEGAFGGHEGEVTWVVYPASSKECALDLTLDGVAPLVEPASLGPELWAAAFPRLEGDGALVVGGDAQKVRWPDE